MICTKAYIAKLPDEGSNVFQVRVPLMEDNTGKEAIFDALLCTSSNDYNGYAVGDCVYVDFEDDQYNNAVILGKLYVDVKEDNNSYTLTNELKVTGSATLPEDTKLGDITVKDLNNMYNSISNVSNTTIIEGSQEYHTFTLNHTKWIASEETSEEASYYMYILSGDKRIEDVDYYPELSKLTGEENPVWDIIVDPTDEFIPYKTQVKYRAWCTTLETHPKYMVLMAMNRPTEDDIVLETIGLNLGFSER